MSNAAAAMHAATGTFRAQTRARLVPAFINDGTACKNKATDGLLIVVEKTIL